jgi:hypothetical protein
MRIGKATKIFDPVDGYAPLTDPLIVTDSTVAKRGNRWWMFLAGKVNGREGIQLFSAVLPEDAPLAATGWTLIPDRDRADRAAMLAGQETSKAWDLKGGRHCPSYVKGWDPDREAWVERIYYAGGADSLWGPYTIGYLEWDGTRWVEQPSPVFVANEPWERGSVYEPNLIYADGKWKLWYVAGSNQEDYLVQGFAESSDGRSDWTKHQVFFTAEEKVFDFCVVARPEGFEAVFSRVWLAQTPPPERTGLWWCHAAKPLSNPSDWSPPVQIMTAEDCGWHGGPWKPSVQYEETNPNRMFVFFDGLRTKKEPGAFGFQFTLGCLEVEHRG